jgi:hypothetical protein
MGMPGKAALVMWWDITPEDTSEFEDWHSHEHMPERLSIPGFLRGRRWMTLADSPKYFIMYEVERFETLFSKPYLERLNNPTTWSTKMFARFRNMTRSTCHVRGSFGSGMGHTLLTLRLSPVPGQEDPLRAWLTQRILPGLAGQVGLVGAHLLENQGRVGQTPTKEQELRGGDATADWVLLVEGYDSDAVAGLSVNELSRNVLAERGASPEQAIGLYRLAFALTQSDVTGST